MGRRSWLIVGVVALAACLLVLAFLRGRRRPGLGPVASPSSDVRLPLPQQASPSIRPAPPRSGPSAPAPVQLGPTGDNARFLSATAGQRATGDTSFPDWTADAGPIPGRPAHQCTSDADCPTGTACGFDAREKPSILRCLPGNCEKDADCVGGEQCTQASSGTSGTLIRRCTPPGPRELGQSCSMSAVDALCGMGLTCISNACYQNCPDRKCPGGQRCVDTSFAPVCVSWCERDDDCGQGERCIGEGVRLCRKVVGPACFEKGCGAGEDCVIAVGRTEVHSACAKCCNPLDATSCGEGEVCGASQDGEGCSSVCYRACQSAADCPARFACQTVDEEQKVPACVPAAR